MYYNFGVLIIVLMKIVKFFRQDKTIVLKNYRKFQYNNVVICIEIKLL